MTPRATHNLNVRLSTPERPDRRPSSVSRSWTESPIRSSAPPVRIVGAASRYQGGYRVNV